MLKDFGNSSFQLELPAHLKQHGIHDVFHSSLLRIHVPNNDRLFPGRMDTQLTGDDDDDEWAVDRILSHHGSQMDASFEILWKSGDVTWLPYYQITHLQALTDYLELLKVKKISKLPTGHGRWSRSICLGNQRMGTQVEGLRVASSKQLVAQGKPRCDW